MLDRRVSLGKSEIYDSYTLALDTQDPLQVVYEEGTDKELKLIFIFNLIEPGSEMSRMEVTPIDDAATLNIDVVRGKRGGMKDRQLIAESEQNLLYIYIQYNVAKNGHMLFSYTLYNEEKKSKKKAIKKAK
jgi:hypothetical protein